MTITVLVLAPDPAGEIREAIENSSGAGVRVIAPAASNPAALADVLPEADVIVADWSGAYRLGAGESALATKVRLIQQPGTGVDFIDLEVWSARGVPVANTAGQNAASVAEWCVAATLELVRRIGPADRAVRDGQWAQADLTDRMTDLGDLTVGIIGAGAIGRASARVFSAFGCPVFYHSRTATSSFPGGYRTLDDLVRTADVLLLAVPLTAETENLIDARRLGTMKAGSFLVNASRGRVVDELRLAELVEAGHFAGVALDVYREEPLPAGSALRALPGVLLSPHIAGATRSARRRMNRAVADNISRLMAGEDLECVVNPGAPGSGSQQLHHPTCH